MTPRPSLAPAHWSRPPRSPCPISPEPSRRATPMEPSRRRSVRSSAHWDGRLRGVVVFVWGGTRDLPARCQKVRSAD